MDFFEWSQGMETGIGVIDAQHRAITMHSNQYYHAHCLQYADGEVAALRTLIESIATHLSFEDPLLQAAGYPELKRHRREQTAFQQRLEGYLAELELGNGVALTLFSDLRMWLTTHIRYDDAGLSPYLQQQLGGATGASAQNPSTANDPTVDTPR